MNAPEEIDVFISSPLVELSHATQWLNSTLNRHEVLRGVLEKGARLSGCDGVCLVLFNEIEGDRFQIHPFGLSAHFIEKFQTFLNAHLGELDGMGAYEAFSDLPGSTEEGIRSTTAFSLVLNTTTKGAVFFFHFESPSLPEERVELLKHFVKHAASALENARRYEEKERQIRQLNILSEATVSLSTEPEMDSLYQKVSDHALYLVRSEMAMFILLDSDGQQVEKVYLSGEAPERSLELQAEFPPLLADSLAARKVLNCRAGDAALEKLGLPFTLSGSENLLAVPLGQEKAIGLLVLLNAAQGRSFGKEDEDLLLIYSFQTAMAIENARLHVHTRKLAITDGLTGVLNHREFQNKIEAEVRRCKRYRRICSMLMVDIDHFKTFNDTFGHPVGDKVLQGVARAIGASIRHVDSAARYGGEEFVVILPETSSEQAMVVAERIRDRIADRSFSRSLGDHDFFITVSREPYSGGTREVPGSVGKIPETG
jgi:diguanylate cyclase (GGDEF)-like protein